MARGRRRAAATAAIMDALQRAPSLPLPASSSAVESMLALRRFAAGLRRKVVRVGRAGRSGGVELPYLEGGTGAPLVLVHGFADSKDSFVDSARWLTEHYRVILPDVVGFGEATRPPGFDYALPNLVEVFAGFIDALDLPRFHLGGSSLGGAIATLYCLEHRDRVETLTLIGAAGVTMPVPSPLQQEIEAGRNPFCCDSFESYQAFMRFVLERPPPIPYPVQQYLARDFIGRAPLHRKIMDDLLAEELDLTSRLPEIEHPTLLVWGDRDRLIDLSAGRVFHRGIADSQMVILHGIGHCPQYEVPRRVARLVRGFVRPSAPA